MNFTEIRGCVLPTLLAMWKNVFFNKVGSEEVKDEEGKCK
jgi:hypothetical protein